MKMKLLIAVDGSDFSCGAVEALLHQLTLLKEPADIHLVYVHLPVPLEAASRDVDAASLTRYYREEGQAQLGPAQKMLEAAGRRFTSHIHVGDPADTIVRLADELEVDFVCMGTHGHGAVYSMLLGSVSAGVLRKIRCPVLFARLQE